LGEILKTFIVLLILFSSALAASETSLTGHEELEKLAGLQQPLDTSGFVRASLIVSGVTQQGLDAYVRKIEKYLKDIESLKGTKQTDYELGESLLLYLHQRRLKRYASSQSSLQVVIDKGQFNCVSSAILYLIGARHLGLTVEMVRTKKHAFCRIKAAGEWIDVETTTKHGFDPGHTKEFFEEFETLNKFAYAPSTKYKDRKSIGDMETLSLIVQSRLVEEDSNNNPQILRLAVDWYLVNKGESSNEQLAYASISYIDWLNRKKLHNDALSFIKYCKMRFGDGGRLRQTLSTMVRNQIIFLIDKKQLPEAENVLDENTSLLSSASKRTLAEYLLSKVAEDARRNLNYDTALSMTTRLLEKGHLDKSVSRNYFQYLYSKKAEQIARAKGNFAAYEFLKNAPEDVRKIPSINKNKEIYLQHGVHNRFVESFKSGDLEKAEEILREGIAVCDGCETLKKDIQFLSHYQKR